MFGMRQRETGMTKYPVRNRQRVITFAVTIALKEHHPEYECSFYVLISLTPVTG
jgi:hypothetical protein